MLVVQLHHSSSSQADFRQAGFGNDIGASEFAHLCVIAVALRFCSLTKLEILVEHLQAFWRAVSRRSIHWNRSYASLEHGKQGPGDFNIISHLCCRRHFSRPP